MAKRENIILIGFMGSGKSSIGRLLAKRLGYQFLDTDQMIVQRTGQEISQIFAEQGEEAFRDLETAALRSLGHRNRCVVATGGGIVVKERNRPLLRDLGLVVGLCASPEVTFERVSRNNKRPLLQTANPYETMTTLLTARQPLYAEAAQVTIDGSSLTHEEVADRVLAAAREAFGWPQQPA